MRIRSLLTIGALAATTAFGASATAAPDAEHREMAEEMIDKAIAYLRTQQDEATGGWSVPQAGPNIPAVTGLVLNGMLMSDEIDGSDPTVANALEYLYQFQQDDGGIYDVILANYNTAIIVSALTKLHDDPKAREIIDRAIPFLKRLQWSEDAIPGRDDTDQVDRSHPYYGGVGYGGSGRPDNSNLNLMLQALHDAGIDPEEQVFQRALVFLQRTQMLHKDADGNVINDMPYAEGSQQGGFIYATSPNEDNQGIGESKAGTIEETLSDGTVASRLRAYGSMTYAGFKSYIYANLDRDDPRVVAAYNWLRENYRLDENPGIGMDGYYYFLITMSRAMDAWGAPEIEVVSKQLSGALNWTTSDRGEKTYFIEIVDDRVDLTFDDDAVISDANLLETIEVSGELESGERFTGWVIMGSGRNRADLIVHEPRNWSNDLIAKLAEFQNEDGSFRSVDDRWMEGNPVLITAYSLIALQHAIN